MIFLLPPPPPARIPYAPSLISLALSLFFVLGLLSCGPGAGTTAGLGEELVITNAQVFDLSGDPLNALDADLTTLDSQPIANAVTVLTAGTIVDGKFSVKLGTPKALAPMTLPPGDGITVSPSDVKTYSITSWGIKDSLESESSMTNMKGSGTAITMVQYLYVDRDASISGSATNPQNPNMKAVMNLSLKAGWNTILSETSVAGAITTITMTSGTPTSDFKWTQTPGGGES